MVPLSNTICSSQFRLCHKGTVDHRDGIAKTRMAIIRDMEGQSDEMALVTP
jgi:hypothetical protein